MSNYILAKCDPPGEHYEQLVVVVTLTPELMARIAQLQMLFEQIHNSDESVYGINCWFGDSEFYEFDCRFPQMIDVPYKKYKRRPKLGQEANVECQMLMATEHGIVFSAHRRHEDAGEHASRPIPWKEFT